MATWLKLNQSYRALQIYAQQMERQQYLSSACVSSREHLQTYKNKLAHARYHSYHISKSGVDPCQNGRDNSVTSNEDGQTDRQTAFQLYIVDMVS